MSVTVAAAATQANQNLTALAVDINQTLAAANLSSDIKALAGGSKIELEDASSTVGQFSIQNVDPTNAAATQLGFVSGQHSTAVFGFNTIQDLVPLPGQHDARFT